MSTVEVKNCAAQPTASVRVRVNPAELATVFPRYLPVIGARAGQVGAAIAGPPFARYHAMSATEFDVELGVPLARPMVGQQALFDAGEGEIGHSELPDCRAATLVYHGPYGGLGGAWDELQTWVEREGLVATAAGWEVYVDDPERVPAQQLRTELYLPVG